MNHYRITVHNPNNGHERHVCDTPTLADARLVQTALQRPGILAEGTEVRWSLLEPHAQPTKVAA